MIIRLNIKQLLKKKFSTKNSNSTTNSKFHNDIRDKKK